MEHHHELDIAKLDERLKVEGANREAYRRKSASQTRSAKRDTLAHMGAMEYSITNDKDPRCEPRVRVAHGFFERVAVALNLQPDPVAKPDCRNYRFC
jgi:hypothetical protein